MQGCHVGYRLPASRQAHAAAARGAQGTWAQGAQVRDTSQPQSCAHTTATGRAIHLQSHFGLNTRMMLSFLFCAEAAAQLCPWPRHWHPLSPAWSSFPITLGCSFPITLGSPKPLPALSTSQRAANCQSQRRLNHGLGVTGQCECCPQELPCCPQQLTLLLCPCALGTPLRQAITTQRLWHFLRTPQIAFFTPHCSVPTPIRVICAFA